MKKVKKLLLFLYVPAFVLLISWILSLNKEFNWSGIFVFLAVVISTDIVLYCKNSQKLIEVFSGWMVTGTFLALVSTEGICGEYADIFETMTLIVFASTYFFICFPEMIKSQKKRKS